jgi:hypothetical protein
VVKGEGLRPETVRHDGSECVVELEAELGIHSKLDGHRGGGSGIVCKWESNTVHDCLIVVAHNSPM